MRIVLEAGRVPTAVLNAMRGMREGGKRRILVTPNFGCVQLSASIAS